MILENKKKFLSFYKNYVKLFSPSYYKYIKDSTLVFKLHSKKKVLPKIHRYTIAEVDIDTKQICVYSIKDGVDLSRTILHEFAHIICDKKYHSINHDKNWKKILNELLFLFKSIPKVKQNALF